MLRWSIVCNSVAIAISIIVGFFIPTTYGGFGISALLLAGILCYNILSLKKIGPTELGALLFFGRPIREVKSGLIYAPLGFITITKETRLVIQEQYPDDPENVWKGNDNERPQGKVPPIRVTHAGATKEEEEKEDKRGDSLKKRLTTEISIIVRYRIGNFIIFLTTIGSVKEVRRQIRDSIVAKAREDLAQKNPAETLAHWGKINLSLKEHIKKMVKSWGLVIEDVRLEEVDLGKTVNQGLRDVPAAELKKQATVIDAEAEQIKLEKEGRGNAIAAELLLKAKATGYKKIATDLDIKEGEVVLAMEAVTTALKQGNQVIISGSDGLKDLITMGRALAVTKEKGVPTT